jgi:hypothetical protein
MSREIGVAAHEYDIFFGIKDASARGEAKNVVAP